MSPMVRGGGTNPGGSALPGAAASSFGLPPLYISIGTFALPFAALSAAITQAFTFGIAVSRHLAKLASPAPDARMHAMTVPKRRDCHRREPHQADDQQHQKHALTVSTQPVLRHLTPKLRRNGQRFR